MTQTTRPVGPVDIAVIGFSGELGDTGVAAAVAQAVAAGTVRVLDVLVVQKDLDGAITMIDAETAEGADLLGFPADLPDMVGEEDAMAIASEIGPGSSVVIIVWENVWAAQIAAAVQGAGGQLLTLQRIPAEDVREVLETIDTDAGGES